MALLPDSGGILTAWEMRSPETVRSGVYFERCDVLVAKITPCFENGKQALVRHLPTDWGYATTEVFPLRGVLVTSDFLDLYLRLPAVRRFLTGRMEGTTGRQRLGKGALASLPITVPPITEQHAIAHVLRTVQHAKEQTEQAITATEALKRSLMRHLFCYGFTPVEEVEMLACNDASYGTVRSDWTLVPLGSVCEFRGGTQPPKSTFIYKPRDGYIRLLQIRDFASDEYPTYVSRDHRLRLVEDNDVLIGRYFAGEVKILRGKAGAINVALVKTEPDESRILARYLYYVLQDAPFQRFVLSLGGRSAQPGFNKGEIGSLAIPLPELGQQVKIAEALETLDGKIAADRARYEALGVLFDSLLHNLMTARLRVGHIAPSFSE